MPKQLVDSHSTSIKGVGLAGPLIHKAAISLNGLCLLEAKLIKIIGKRLRSSRSIILSLCFLICSWPFLSIKAVQNGNTYLFDKVPNYYIFQNTLMSSSGPDRILNFPEAGYHPDILPRSPAISLLVEPLWTGGHSSGREGKNENTQKTRILKTVLPLKEI